MSTSGTYQYWDKVLHPNSILPQMTGDTHLPPFFYGGSQVPNALHIAIGSGLKPKFYNSKILQGVKDLQGRGIHTTYEHTDRIMMPKHMRRI